MRGATKFLSILIAVIMLVQMIPMVAMAANPAPYDLKWVEADPGTIFFRPADNVNIHYISVYKGENEIDGTWYYTNEEEVATGVTYEFFKFDIAECGAGAYTFTVSTVTDNLEINDDAVTSPVFNYNPPAAAVAPYDVKISTDGVIDWKCDDASINDFVVFYTCTYDDKEYFELTFDEVTGKEWQIDNSVVQQYYEQVESWGLEDSYYYPEDKAKFAAFIYAIPQDRTVKEMSKSAPCVWTDISSDYIPPKTDDVTNPDEDALDRTTVDEKYYDGAKAVYDLGIMPLVYTQPTEIITKGEFAIVLTAMLDGKEAAVAMQDTPYFSDAAVGTELNGCINYVRNMGIITGNTDGTFGADNEVAYEDAVTALVRILGYEPYAQAYGYPTGYLRVASQYGISDGVSLATGTAIKTQELAQLVSNSLEIGKLVQESFNIGGTSSYVISKKTLLNDNLGYTLAYGELTVNEDKATIDGRAFDKESLNGRFQKYDDLTINDADVKALDGKDVKLYVKDNTVYCGFEYYGGEVIINNGEETTKSNVVDVQVVLYSYTKYKYGDIEYKPASDNKFTYTFSNVDGKKSLYVYFANDDETLTGNAKGEITYDNKRTITYMANGQVYKTVTVGVGKSFTTPYPNDIVGYKFNKWIGVPTDNIMPDKDITIIADLTKLTNVTAKLMYKGNPLAWARVSEMLEGGSELNLGSPDSEGNLVLYLEPGEKMLHIVGQYVAGANITIPIVVGSKDIDLGTIELDQTSANARIDSSAVKTVTIPDAVFTAEDEEYATVSIYNTVEIKVAVQESYSSDKGGIKEVLAEQYPEYRPSVSMPDITVTKSKGGTQSGTTIITELPALITIKMEIEEDILHKSDFVVVREHNGGYDALTTTPNAGGEYIEIDGEYVYIHAKKFSTYSLAGKGFRFTNVQKEGFGFKDMSAAEVTLGNDNGNGNKIITVADTPMFYSPQRGIYVALVDTAVIGNGNAVADYQITDGEPEIVVYGNVNGNYNYTDISKAVDGTDVLFLKRANVGTVTLTPRQLYAADVNGDGKANGTDVLILKRYNVGTLTVFPVLSK